MKATHHFLHNLNITPIIDINCRRKDKNPFCSFAHLDGHSIPKCMNNIPMVNWGYDNKKCRTKYRCPLATGKISSCSHKQECCPNSDYGKVRYIKIKMTSSYLDLCHSNLINEKQSIRIVNVQNVLIIAY